ncbi:MAG: DUF87 domain-containing protein [Planctomycetes bacterium]|nr:DUF87 domain-containing protein [Planctomycetota bacterium]
MLVVVATPPTNDRGPQYMDQALAAIHQGNPRRLPVSFEFAWRDGTVTLYCRFPPELRAVVEGQLYAQYPDCKIERLSDEALNCVACDTTWTAELRLRADVFPIKRYPQFEDALNRVTSDPLTAILTTLASDKRERLRTRMEIIVRPTSRRLQARGKKCLRRLAQPFFRSHPKLAHAYAIAAMSRLIHVRAAGFMLGLFGRRGERVNDDALTTSATRLHDREEDLQAASDKLGRLLFDARIRLSVSGPKEAKSLARRKLREMAGAFGQFSLPRSGSFRLCRCSRPFLLSTEEAATLWHPPTAAVRAPAMAVVESRELEAPVTLPGATQAQDLATLGATVFRGRRERFGILADDRRRHVAILGKTGMGKSTLLYNLLVSDIHAGRGVALIDPHGDLADALLQAVPPRRTNDVVLFDAGDTGHPLSFNVRACDRAEQRPLVASGIIGAFKKAYGDSWGPRLEHILRNALPTSWKCPTHRLCHFCVFSSKPSTARTSSPESPTRLCERSGSGSSPACHRDSRRRRWPRSRTRSATSSVRRCFGTSSANREPPWTCER